MYQHLNSKTAPEGKSYTVPERKTAHWIGESDGYADGEPVYDVWYCSACDFCFDGDEKPD